MSNQPKTWRKSDQINSELPLGQAYCDVNQVIMRVEIRDVKNPETGATNWCAYPEQFPEALKYGSGPSDAVVLLDKALSRHQARMRTDPV